MATTGDWANPKLWVTCLTLLWSVQGNAHLAAPRVSSTGTQSTLRLAAFAGTTSPLRAGALASTSLHLVGLRLTAPTNRIDVPKGAPFSVPVGVWIGDHQATPTEVSSGVPAGATLTATLTRDQGSPRP